jgi:F-type H+-transporting ATPase subunit delta
MKATRKTRRSARHLFRFCVVGGALDSARVRQVAAHVAASGRRGALAVLSDFQRMVRLEGDRHRAIIESARPLTDDLRNDVATHLTRMYGTGLDTSFEENPALIAGMRIRVGSDVYDGSVRARLASIDAGLSE